MDTDIISTHHGYHMIIITLQLVYMVDIKSEPKAGSAVSPNWVQTYLRVAQSNAYTGMKSPRLPLDENAQVAFEECS